VRPLYGEARFVTGIGEGTQVMLADGSQVRLDADSELDVRYQPFSREARLSHGAGEFTVAHNSWRPFSVVAGAAEIRVTGTHFLVRRQGEGASAYLISGGIELRDPRTGERKAELRPGTGATISAAGVVSTQASDGSRDKAWLSGKLLFDQTALADALDQFRPYGPVAVRLGSDELRSLRISGLYSSNDLDGFLQSVATFYPLRLTASAEGGVLVEKLPGKK
jgi:transmembrane sensor